MSKLSLMGHSFGGGASLLAMIKDDRPKCVENLNIIRSNNIPYNNYLVL